MPDAQVDMDTIKEITDMFIDAGIHMDAVNADGLTASQIWTSRKHCSLCTSTLQCASFPCVTNRPFRFFYRLAFLQVLLRRYEFNEVTLRCLASRCIAQHKIVYTDIVPKHLEMFIEMHSAEKV